MSSSNIEKKSSQETFLAPIQKSVKVMPKWNLLVVCLFSIVMGLFILPYIYSDYKDYIKPLVIPSYIIFVALLIMGFKREKLAWERYQKTCNLENPPFILWNAFYLFLGLTWAFYFAHSFTPDSFNFPTPQESFSTRTDSAILFYLTPLTAFLYLVIIAHFSEKEETVHKETEEKSDATLFDDPINDLDDDRLGMESFIDALKDTITYLPKNISYVYGLTGGWGNGKTSVLNMLRQKLESNGQFLVMDFDPWAYSDSTAFGKGFLSQIDATINSVYHMPKLKTKVWQYKELIFSGITKKVFGDSFPKEEVTLEQVKDKIEEFLGRTGKKLVIIVDDIDRLQNHGILEIFKIVGHNAKMKNIIFILAFDDAVVHRHLEKELKIDSDYIEKIVNRKIPLPAIEPVVVLNFLSKELDKLKNKIGIEDEVWGDFMQEFKPAVEIKGFAHSTIKDLIRPVIKNLRNAKQILNGLRATLPQIKDEVLISDFFVLEVLRIYYPQIYNYLWEKDPFHIIIPDHTIRDDNKDNESKNKARNTALREGIKKVLTKEDDLDIVMNLLAFLFYEKMPEKLAYHFIVRSFSDSEIRIRHGIVDEGSFAKYFMFKVPSGDIPNESIKTIVGDWNSEPDIQKLKTKIKKVFRHTNKRYSLEAFLIKFKEFHSYFNIEPSKATIEVIYMNQKLFKKSDKSTQHSEFHSALLLMENLLNNNIPEEEMQQFCEKIISESDDFYLIMLFVLHLAQRKDRIYKVTDGTDLHKLKSLATKKLHSHFIEGGDDLLKETNRFGVQPIFYNWLGNWGSYDLENAKEVATYFTNQMQKSPKRLAKVLSFYTTLDYGDGVSLNLNDLGKVFNLESLVSIAEEHQVNKELTEEAKETIELFLSTVKKQEEWQEEKRRIEAKKAKGKKRSIKPSYATATKDEKKKEKKKSKAEELLETMGEEPSNPKEKKSKAREILDLLDEDENPEGHE